MIFATSRKETRLVSIYLKLVDLANKFFDTTSISDILGVVFNVSDLYYCFTAMNGLQPLRYIELVDMSCSVIALTVWGEVAENFEDNNNEVMSLKAARVLENNGGWQLRYTADCIMELEPQMDEAEELRHWFIYDFNQVIEYYNYLSNWHDDVE